MAVLTKANHSQPPKMLESTRILHLYKKEIPGGKAQILDSDKQTVLYEIDVHTTPFRSPNISLYRGRGSPQENPRGALVGTANFHSLSSTTDLKIVGNSAVIPLRAQGFFSSSRTFDSIIGPLKWQRDGLFSRSLSLVNPQGEWFARFQYVTAVSKWGCFEIAPGVPKGGDRLLDEIVLSGFAILESLRRVAPGGV